MGFKDCTWLDFAGMPHSEALRITERIRRTRFGRLEIEQTVHDPEVFTRPFTVQLAAHFVPDTELLEYVCAENERSRRHMVGPMSEEITRNLASASRSHVSSGEVCRDVRLPLAENPTTPSFMEIRMDGDRLLVGNGPLIITWSRLVGGRWRDPLVARDALTAVASVTASYTLLRLVQLAAVRAGEAPFPPTASGLFGIDLGHFLGGEVMVSTILRPLFGGPTVSLTLFFLMFVTFALLRKKWLAAVAYVVLGTLAYAPLIAGATWIHWFQWLLEMGFLLFLTLRFGLLAAAIFSCLSQILSQAALTYRFDEWYGQVSLIATAIVAVLTLYGLRVSLSGRSLLGGLERVRS